MDKYYEKDGVVVRYSKLEDALGLSERLRQSDIDEIWASDNITPREALVSSLEKSTLVFTIEYFGKPVCMFGIVPESIFSRKASIWMLASDEISNIKIRFLRNSKNFIDSMLTIYPYLHNFVDRRNTKSIEWLRFLGANIKDAEPYGVEQRLFHYFSLSKG